MSRFNFDSLTASLEDIEAMVVGSKDPFAKALEEAVAADQADEKELEKEIKEVLEDKELDTEEKVEEIEEIIDEIKDELEEKKDEEVEEEVEVATESAAIAVESFALNLMYSQLESVSTEEAAGEEGKAKEKGWIAKVIEWVKRLIANIANFFGRIVNKFKLWLFKDGANAIEALEKAKKDRRITSEEWTKIAKGVEFGIKGFGEGGDWATDLDSLFKLFETTGATKGVEGLELAETVKALPKIESRPTNLLTSEGDLAKMTSKEAFGKLYDSCEKTRKNLDAGLKKMEKLAESAEDKAKVNTAKTNLTTMGANINKILGVAMSNGSATVKAIKRATSAVKGAKITTIVDDGKKGGQPSGIPGYNADEQKKANTDNDQ